MHICGADYFIFYKKVAYGVRRGAGPGRLLTYVNCFRMMNLWYELVVNEINKLYPTKSYCILICKHQVGLQ